MFPRPCDESVFYTRRASCPLSYLLPPAILCRWPIPSRLARSGAGLERMARPGGQPARKPPSPPGVPTLDDAARAVISLHKHEWRQGGRTQESWERSFRRFPTLGKVPVSELDAPRILAKVEPEWSRERRAMDDLLTRLSTVCRWAIAQGLRTNDPVPAVRAALPRNGRSKGSFEALPHAGVGSVLRTVRADPRRAAALALELVVLTAVHSGEARGARWSELDLDARTWTIPGARMKAGVEHVVALSPRAVEVLEEARALGGEDLVFPAPRGGGALSDSSLSRVLRAAGVARATVHGMRSSFRDWCAESGVDPDLAETALAHARGGVEGAYLRTRRLEERRAVMERWAEYLGA